MKMRGMAAVVTGSTRGVGLGIARVFAQEGAMPMVVSRGELSVETVEELVKLGAAGAFFLCAPTNVLYQ